MLAGGTVFEGTAGPLECGRTNGAQEEEEETKGVKVRMVGMWECARHNTTCVTIMYDVHNHQHQHYSHEPSYIMNINDKFNYTTL